MDLVLLRLQPLKESVDAVPLSPSFAQEIPLRWLEIFEGYVEPQAILRRRPLQVFIAVLVARGVPRRDGQLIQPQIVVRDHLLHIDADDSPVALAMRAGSQRRIE